MTPSFFPTQDNRLGGTAVRNKLQPGDVCKQKMLLLLGSNSPTFIISGAQQGAKTPLCRHQLLPVLLVWCTTIIKVENHSDFPYKIEWSLFILDLC